MTIEEAETLLLARSDLLKLVAAVRTLRQVYARVKTPGAKAAARELAEAQSGVWDAHRASAADTDEAAQVWRQHQRGLRRTVLNRDTEVQP